MPTAKPVLLNMKSRITNRLGSDTFGVPKGARRHFSLDIEASSGENVYSPINGVLTREALPHPNDLSSRGVFIQGTGAWEGYVVKIFYIQGINNGNVTQGQHIGFVQDLARKNSGINNHIHVEVLHNGAYIKPMKIWDSPRAFHVSFDHLLEPELQYSRLHQAKISLGIYALLSRFGQFLIRIFHIKSNHL